MPAPASAAVDPAGNIRIGTASWTDKSLLDSGKFYPAAATSPEDRLRFYASQFPLVEDDSTYYAIPTPASAALWSERTPPGFRFNVKAFRLFTGHQTAPAVLPKAIREALPDPTRRHVYYNDVPRELRDALWQLFREAVGPLRAAGKLAALHFQFAPWMAFHRDSFAHIEACQNELPGFHLAVEFRNKTWFAPSRHADSTLRFERERGLTNVIVDEPQGFANCIPSVWEVTTPGLAILRLHGRNHGTWNTKGLKSSAERFNYDYNTQELKEMAARAVTLSPEVTEMHVVLNNNYEDQGQRNAKELIRLVNVLRSGSAAASFHRPGSASTAR